MLGQRQGLIVWLYSLKQAKNLKRYGNVHYISKRLKYAVLYCNLVEREDIMKRLESLSYVKKVEISYRPYVRTEYESKKQDTEEEEYDYKVGL